jgi:hypothetical protein
MAPRERHALALPARELRGLAVGEAAQRHEVERLARAGLAVGPRDARDHGAVGHVAHDVEVGEERVVWNTVLTARR